MSDGFVRLYRRDWTPARVRRRVDSLAATGMVLAYPGTGRITAFDEIGEQVEMFREELLAAMAAVGDKHFTFRYWLEDDPDATVIASVRRVGGDVVVEEYSLDGFGGPVYRKGQDTVIRRLLAEFRATESAIGLIVDRWGPSGEDDQDDIVIGGPARVTVVPELMVLRPDIARRNWASSELVPHGDFLAHDTDGILTLAG
ncbi:hypothetical protein [Kutzneria chonburiensis]|uniref:Uncharacterized protein n=1 Tax=Kutzneria chonburiensis TaxID=1483604 RepID=A0ABV6MQY0_9PSEU|nr:hypothetical protein [Kutzneria chonburiensis]